MVRLPAKAKPEAKDYIAVVKATKDPAAAAGFVKRCCRPRVRPSSTPRASAGRDLRGGESGPAAGTTLARLTFGVATLR